jgi:hypothetical protein
MPIYRISHIRSICLGVLLMLMIGQGQAADGKSYAPGVTDTEIKLGQTMPYSGPAQSWGTRAYRPSLFHHGE